MSLRLAPATETVTVSATRTLVPSSAAGADVEILNAGQLEVMRPVAADDALHFLPGAVVSTAGQRGGLSSLFVRGGESTYNKVIVDGVPVNDPGGIFDFGVLPLAGADRLEFVRGSQSTLYGSDAMTSVVQVFTRTGSTPVPELRFGADGGNLGTANGYASLAGAHGRFDYNLFGDQFNTMGQGPNDDYSNSLQGGNVGVKLTDWAALRLRARHSNSATGVQSYWNFNGDPILPPDFDQRARQNNLLASAELTHRRAIALAASLHRLRVRTASHQYSARQSARPRGPFRQPDRYSFPCHHRHQSRRLRLSGRLHGAKLGPDHGGI